MPTSGPAASTSTDSGAPTGTPPATVHDSTSHASYCTGRSGASSSSAPAPPAGSSSRPRATSMTDVSVAVEAPADGEAAVGHRAVGDDDVAGPARADAAGSGDATSGASPRPGAVTNAAVRPSSSCCVGPSPGGAPSTTTTSRAVDRGGVGDDRAARRPAAPSRVADAPLELGGDALERLLGVGVHPGDRRARAGCRGTAASAPRATARRARAASTTSPAAAAVAAHSSASRSSRSHRRLPSLVRSWLVNVPRWVSKYSSPRHTGTGAPAAASASTCSKNRAADPSSTCGIGVEVGEPGGARRASPASARRRRRRSRTGSATHRSRRARRSAPSTPLSSAGRDLGAVGVDRREVREHAAPVEPLPPERVVGEAVGAVPRQLLRDEAAHAAGDEHLRQPGGVAEHVGDPHLGAASRRTARRTSAGRGRSGARCSRPTAGSCRPRPTSRRPGPTARRRPWRRCGRTARARAGAPTRTAAPASSENT